MHVAILTPADGAISRVAFIAKTIFIEKGHDVTLISHSSEGLSDQFYRRIEKVGFWSALDEISYCFYEQWLTPWDEAITELGLNNLPTFDVHIDNTRSDDLGLFLSKISPNLFIAIGATFINLKSIPSSILSINIHPGILPRYKGVGNPEAVVLGNEFSVGYTIHRLTSRLDDGEILLRNRSFAGSVLNAPLLYLVNYINAINKLANVIYLINTMPWPIEDDFSSFAPDNGNCLWRLTLSSVLKYRIKNFCKFISTKIN